MASRLLCCFGWNINEDHFLEKDIAKRDNITSQQQQNTLSNSAALSDEEAIRQSVIQSSFSDTDHVTSKGSNPQKDGKPELQPPSISCPQLTVDEVVNNCEGSKCHNNELASCTKRGIVNEDKYGSQSSLKHRLAENQLHQNYNFHDDKNRNESNWISIPSKSILTKTYSFKRIISFRSDNFKRGNSKSVTGAGHSPSNFGRSPPSPFYSKDHYRGAGYNSCSTQTYKPLTFSFLGQIYAKKSIKGDKSVPSYSKKRLEAKLSSPANICDESTMTNLRDDSISPIETFEEDES